MSDQHDAHITARNIHVAGSLEAFKTWAAEQRFDYVEARKAYRVLYPIVTRTELAKSDGD